MKQTPRYSIDGFTCPDCETFVFMGYDARDIVVPDGKARCEICAGDYDERVPETAA